MNILIISQYFWPENFRINEISNELSKLGNKVSVLTGMPNYPEGFFYKDFLKNKSSYSRYKNINIFRVPIIPRRRNKFNLFINYISFVISASIFGLFNIKKNDYDIIFVFQTSPVFVGIASSIISKTKNVPQIIWVLDIWPETLISVGITNEFIINFVRKIVNDIYSCSFLVLAQSKSFVENIKKYKSIKNNVFYFPVWSEFNLNLTKQKKAQEIKVRKNCFTIIFAGNIGEAQDFPTIINAIEYLSKNRFNDFRLLVIGDGRKKKWLMKNIKERGLEKYVEIYKKFPLSKMPSIFLHGDALLVSLSDQIAFNMTIPGKVQTYLSTGLPILGILNGEGANLINEAGAGYTCNAGNYKDLANLIIRLKNDPKDLKIKMGQRGKIFGASKFNKKKLMRKLNKIFKHVVINKEVFTNMEYEKF